MRGKSSRSAVVVYFMVCLQYLCRRAASASASASAAHSLSLSGGPEVAGEFPRGVCSLLKEGVSSLEANV